MDTLLDDLLDVAHMGQVKGGGEVDGVRTNLQNLKDFFNDVNNALVIDIFPNSYETSRNATAERVVGNDTLELDSREAPTYTQRPVNLHSRALNRYRNIDSLMNMYGAALTLSPDNLSGLREILGQVHVRKHSDDQEGNLEVRGIDYGFIDNIYGWLTNDLNLSNLSVDNNSAFNSFLFHAMILDAAQGNRPLRESAREFLDRINREKDLPPYKFLKSVMPNPELNRNNSKEKAKDAKRIWGNWVKAVKDLQNYTPAIPLIAALKADPFYKSLADVNKLNLIEEVQKDVRSVEEAGLKTTLETPYVGIGQNPLESTPMREGLGQSYTKKSVRMMLKEAIELGNPNVSHILVPTRYVNEKFGQMSGAHENFDRARNELQNIAKQNGVELRVVNYGEGVPENVAEPTEKQIKEVAEKYRRSIEIDLINRFKESTLEFNIAKNNLRGIRTAYLLPLEPFRVRDDSTPSGFRMKTVFRGMKLGGFVGKGIVGLRDEIYNSPLSKYVT